MLFLYYCQPGITRDTKVTNRSIIYPYISLSMPRRMKGDDSGKLGAH